MTKIYFKVLSFISVAAVIIICLSLISGRYPVSVRDQYLRIVIEKAVADVYSPEAINFQALAVGCSHGRAVDLDALGLKGVNLSMPWLDLYETDYQLRLLLPRLKNVRTVFLAIPYFAFTWDNDLSQDSQLLLSRRLFYYLAPTLKCMPGDIKNFIKGKLWSVLRADHWEHVFFPVPTFRSIDQNGRLVQDVISEDPKLRDEEARNRVAETIAHSRQMISKDFHIRERTFDQLSSLINMLTANKIRLILFTPPYYFKYTEYCGTEVIDPMRQMMRRLLTSKDMEYYDFSEDTDFIYNEQLFANSDHLNARGVSMFSLKLKNVMSRQGSN